MPELRFEWDDAKTETNETKHGISFEIAASVFYDPEALLLADLSHSDEEDRFWMLGLDSTGRELVVCHCYREEDDVIRIISARPAERWEQQAYWESTQR